MSSVRLFILDSFARHGEMHGHQLRLLAEQEHLDLWTDISVGSLYQAIKRLVTEGLLTEVRLEREGSFPERQVFAITKPGLAALKDLRLEGLKHIWMKPDPFDLALARFDPDTLDDLPRVVAERLGDLRSILAATLAQHTRAQPYLSVIETHTMSHTVHRLNAEISWLEGVIAAMPEIMADEAARGSAS
jgi:DNA-binding PadR family transcriptional regulator